MCGRKGIHLFTMVTISGAEVPYQPDGLQPIKVGCPLNGPY